MNVAEMLKNVKAECHPVTNIDSIIIRWLDRGQKVMASKKNFSWLRKTGFSLATVANQELYAFSYLVDNSKQIVVYNTDSPQYVNRIDEMWYRIYNPGPNSTGTPFVMRFVDFWPVQNQPTSSSVLTLVSSSVADSTQTVRIQGLDSNDMTVNDTVTLTGTTPVASTQSFKTVLSLSKSATTTGVVTITSNSGGVTNVRIPAGEKTLQHPVFRLFSIPDGVYTLYYDFYLKLPTLNISTDISLVPEQYHDAIELYAKYNCYKHLNNQSMFQAVKAEFDMRCAEIIKDDTPQSGIWMRDDVLWPDDVLFGPFLPGNYPRGT